MGREYTITNVQRRDEWQSRFGGTFVDYAITLEGDSQGWIKLTQKPETTPPRTGDTIFGTITQEQTRNGTAYRKFKKENPNYTGPGQSTGNQSSGARQEDIDYIIQMLEELTNRRPEPENPQPRGNSASSNGSSDSRQDPDPFEEFGI